MQDQNENEVIAAIINNPASYYESDPNLYRIHEYKEYLRNFLADPEDLPPSFTEWIDRYFNSSRYIHDSENSPVFGRTFQLNLYSDEFFERTIHRCT